MSLILYQVIFFTLRALTIAGYVYFTFEKSLNLLILRRICDIIIDFVPEKETFDNYMLVYDIIENLFKEYKVDLVTMNGLSPHIGPKILKDVKYV